jgi:FkbM family methyltransferase
MRKKSPFKRLSDRIRRDVYFALGGKSMTFHGVPVYVPKGIPWDVFKQLVRGHYEQAEQQLIAKYLNPQLPVLELGGSIGIISAYIGLVLEPTTLHTIVEANPKLIPILERNAYARDGGKFTRIINAAVSTQADSLEFSVTDDYLGNRIAEGQPAESVSVQTINLTRLSEGFERYTLIMDIEGAEFDILRNDANGLSTCELAIIEVHPHYFEDRDGHSEEDFISLAHDAGMRHVETVENVLVFKPIKSDLEEDLETDPAS